MFFPGLEGCERGPSLPCSLLSHCFLYIRSPPSGKLELLLAYPTSASCFSFLGAFVHISSPWDAPPFLVWFHYSCLWAWSRRRLILVSSKDIGDFILIGGEKRILQEKQMSFLSAPHSPFPFPLSLEGFISLMSSVISWAQWLPASPKPYSSV